MTKQKSQQERKMPKNWDEVPEVIEAQQVWRDAMERRDEAVDRCRELETMLNADGEAEMDALAEAALAGGDVATAVKDAVQLERDLAEAEAQLRVLDRALKLASEKREQARHAAMEWIVPVARTEYSAILQRVADAMKEVVAAADTESDFRDRYRFGGGSDIKLFCSHLNPQVPQISKERIKFFLQECVRERFLPESVLDDTESWQ